MNIKYPNKHYFLQSVTDDTLKVFSKDGGVDNAIIFNDGPVGNEIYANPSGTAGASLMQVIAKCTFPGFHKGVCIELNAFCPCEECDYEYGITVWRQAKLPGVRNSDVYRQPYFYGGVIPKISCTGGLIDDSLLIKMEDDIIKQINEDKGLGQDAYGSPVIAKRCFLAKDTDKTTDSTIIISVNGSHYSITVSGNHSANPAGPAFAALINAHASLQGKVVSYPSPTNADEFYICSVDDNYLFVNGSSSGTTVLKRFICLSNKEVDETFTVEIKEGFGKVTGKNIYTFDSKDWTGNDNAIEFYVDGVLVKYNTPSAPTTGGAIATLINNELTSLSIAGIAYYDSSADKLFIILPDGIVSFAYMIPGDSVISFVDGISATGKFSSLTADDIFRIFAYSQDAGFLANEIYKIQPVKGIEYCCYTFKQHHQLTHSLSEGASHFNQYMQEFTVCLPKALAVSAHWNGKLNQVFGTNFDSGN